MLSDACDFPMPPSEWAEYLGEGTGYLNSASAQFLYCHTVAPWGPLTEFRVITGSMCKNPDSRTQLPRLEPKFLAV